MAQFWQLLGDTVTQQLGTVQLPVTTETMRVTQNKHTLLFLKVHVPMNYPRLKMGLFNSKFTLPVKECEEGGTVIYMYIQKTMPTHHMVSN